jgi:hypothetical protein
LAVPQVAEEEQVMLRISNFFLAIFAIVLVAIIAVPALAEDIKGKVMDVNAEKQEFVVKMDVGNDRTITMDEDARVLINGREADLSKLRSGDEVMVRANQNGDRWMAIEVTCERK